MGLGTDRHAAVPGDPVAGQGQPAVPRRDHRRSLTQHPEGSTAPPGVPTDFCDQLGEARHILRWLIGDTDEIPVDDDNRGRFIGARDDYARTDEQIRQVRDRARRGLEAFDLPDPMDPADAQQPMAMGRQHG